MSALRGWGPLCAAAWLAAHPALAQSPQPQFAPPSSPAPQTQPLPQPQPQEAAPPKREGFFDTLGRWFDKSAKDFKASVDESNAKWREFGRKTEQAAKDAAAAQKEATDEFLKAQKEAADAFKKLPNTRVVEGRQVCETAPNGSPDCQAAAEVICKGKGFATGKSADITTSRKCSARGLLQRDESECRTETVVIKAACQ
jgi:hypothetical protein